MAKVEFSKEQQQLIDEMLAQQAADIEKKVDLRIKRERVNEVKVAATIQETKMIPGKPIVDSETGQQKLDNNNQPACYPDKYYASLTFDGGSMECDIDKDKFETLKVGDRYLCGGIVGDVRMFVNKSMVTVKGAVIKSFTQL